MATSIGSGSWRLAAEKAALLLEVLDPAVLAELAKDPFSAIERHFDVSVELRDVDPDTHSPVIGHFFPDSRRIVVGQALSTARMRFTALHELGHHLITHHEDLALELMGPPPRHALEESICDSFAGGVLIPEELVEQVIGDTGPTAEAVVELYRRSNASRAAAAVRAAERLGASGHVMITDLAGVAQFTATRGIDYPVSPGAQQHDGVVRRAGVKRSARGDDHVTYRTGNPSEKFHVDALADGDYVFAVFTKGEASWVKLHILGDSLPGPTEVTCLSCGEEFEAWQKHDACGEPPCPHCGRCGCHRMREVEESMCTECFKLVAVHRLEGGICSDCR